MYSLPGFSTGVLDLSSRDLAFFSRLRPLFILSKNPSRLSNSILQYWFYGTSVEILATNYQKWGLGFAYQAQNCNACFVKTKLYNTFSYILFNALTEAIKPNVEKIVQEREVGRVQNKTSFVTFCVRFVSANKNIIQKKRDS